MVMICYGIWFVGKKGVAWLKMVTTIGLTDLLVFVGAILTF
ncbi:hypothetical protein [Caldibacillus thermoamylovorans]|jgi:hypothetical protein|nr:hypothetical protein [Caldibacillus thermoamylovorans]